jgi:hypothetical protein
MRFHVRRRARQPITRAGGSALRTLAAGALFLFGGGAVLGRLGYPVPGVSELLGYLESVGQLADLLS